MISFIKEKQKKGIFGMLNKLPYKFPFIGLGGDKYELNLEPIGSTIVSEIVQ